MTEPSLYNPLTTPAVKIAGKLWPVPKLAPRQYRKIWDDVIAVTDAIDAALPLPPPEVAIYDLPERVLKLSTEIFDRLQNCVYWGLTRAHPDLTLEEFLDMEASPPALVHAFLVVRSQTDMFAPRTAEEGGNVGEESGASAPPVQTGTD